MTKKEQTKLIKELALHFGERVSCEWLSSDGQDWTSWKNVEITVLFLINVEKGYVRNIQIYQTKITIRAELITTFGNFREWTDKATTSAVGYTPDEIVYVDQSSKILLTEEDFLFAQENNLFPVNAYRMKRITDK